MHLGDVIPAGKKDQNGAVAWTSDRDVFDQINNDIIVNFARVHIGNDIYGLTPVASLRQLSSLVRMIWRMSSMLLTKQA